EDHTARVGRDARRAEASLVQRGALEHAAEGSTLADRATWGNRRAPIVAAIARDRYAPLSSSGVREATAEAPIEPTSLRARDRIRRARCGRHAPGRARAPSGGARSGRSRAFCERLPRRALRSRGCGLRWRAARARRAR